MSEQDRERQLRVVAELLLVHLPATLEGDQALAHDLLAVVGTSLHTVYDDAEQSAKAWDKKAYHVKADELRQVWAWALAAANYATGLALRADPLTAEAVAKVCRLIKPGLEPPARRQITDPVRFRGAAGAVRQQQSRKPVPVRG